MIFYILIFLSQEKIIVFWPSLDKSKTNIFAKIWSVNIYKWDFLFCWHIFSHTLHPFFLETRDFNIFLMFLQCSWIERLKLVFHSKRQVILFIIMHKTYLHFHVFSSRLWTRSSSLFLISWLPQRVTRKTKYFYTSTYSDLIQFSLVLEIGNYNLF